MSSNPPPSSVRCWPHAAKRNEVSWCCTCIVFLGVRIWWKKYWISAHHVTGTYSWRASSQGACRSKTLSWPYVNSDAGNLTVWAVAWNSRSESCAGKSSFNVDLSLVALCVNEVLVMAATSGSALCPVSKMSSNCWQIHASRICRHNHRWSSLLRVRLMTPSFWASHHLVQRYLCHLSWSPIMRQQSDSQFHPYAIHQIQIRIEGFTSTAISVLSARLRIYFIASSSGQMVNLGPS